MKNYFSPDDVHLNSYTHPELSYSPNAPFGEWKSKLQERYLAVLGQMPLRTPLNLRKEFEEKMDGYTNIRLVFDSEPGVSVPCHLLLPDNVVTPPVVICLQGHSSGMHISFGVEKYPGDRETIDGGRDFALQAVKQGYAALALEQRGLGERKSTVLAGQGCYFPSMSALLLGRTLIGERVWDISRAIDMLEELPYINKDKVAVMGNSGGGTVTYYAACFDERIKIAMPSCSVCTYRSSIGAVYHCSCNYIPHAAQSFDMGDLSALIAPRPLVMVTGAKDEIFPIHGAEQTYNTIQAIYASQGAKDNCSLVIGKEGHQFYPDEAWPIFNDYSQKLKW